MLIKKSKPRTSQIEQPLSRRDFIRTAAGLSAAGLLLTSPHAWAARIANGDNQSRRLVVVFLRGAVDGLNVVVPYGDHEYYDARPNIAIPRRGDGAVINLDGHFGLNPALNSLTPAWRDGTLAFIHACGSPDPTRSHFDAQDYMESGTPGIRTTPDGWMNRLLAAIPNHSPAEAISLGPTVPRILGGKMAVASVALGRGATRPLPLDNPRIQAAFDRLYEGSDPLSRAYHEGRAARTQLLGELQVDMAQADNGAPSPDGFAQDAQRLAGLIRHDPTIRLAFMALGGWDTHINQGSVQGQLANHLRQLGSGLAGFARQLGPAYADTVILAISEFGRTLHENGNGGTDHGHGNVMWVMGGPVRGGRVYGRWPGLAAAELYQERDLAITTDFREPIGQILQTHLDVQANQLAAIIPGYRSASSNLGTLIA